jgi:hypothetical protein
VQVSIGAIATVTGVSATGRTGQVIVWGPIKPDPGNDWTDVTTPDITDWTEVNPGAGDIWTPIAA